MNGNSLFFFFALVVSSLFLTELRAQEGRVSESEVNTQKVFIDANKEKILGNYENAAYLYKEVLNRDKKNHAAAYELARIYDVLDKDDKALQSIKMAISLDDNPWYRMFLADVYEKSARFGQAADVYEKLAKENPTEEYHYIKWAFYLVKAQESAKAIKVYDLLEEQLGVSEEIIRKKQTLYLGTGNIKKAAAEIQKLIQAYPSNLDYYHYLADFYNQVGEQKEAAKVYQKIIELDPDDGKAALALAGESSNNGSGDAGSDYLSTLQPIFENPETDIDLKIKELIPFIQQVADKGDRELAAAGIELARILAIVHPREAKSYAAYGDLLYYSGQKEAALEKYLKAIELNSNVFTIWEQVMYIQAEGNQFDELARISEQAMDVFPNQPKVFYFNGIGNFEIGRYNDAVSSFQQAMIMSRKDPRLQSDVLKRLGATYSLLKKYKKSDDAFEKALKLNPDDYVALNHYAYYLTQREASLDKALELVEKANKIRPKQADVLGTYALIFYKKKEYNKAKDYLDQAISNGGNSLPDVLEQYGDVLFQLGDTENAARFWQQALEKGSRSKNLQKKITDKQLYE